jgi:hypothetical protein
MAASSNPLQRGSWGCGMFVHNNHAAGGENKYELFLRPVKNAIVFYLEF